ncbi:Homeodomain-like superfamily protein [Thalictrum thalictroides]|uniref:Homeodomain-like superfamily protein n=1 Tax=Thalictrum thalictroides TaxID=46969 RepID=A0A7J6WDG5_THATH|nr:Homeodomain-like superfamily protein [Thalictrum thalictroides]
MKETSSPEASSSLSSDDEGLGPDAVYSWGSPSARKETSLALDSVAAIQQCTIHDEEEVLTPKADSLEEERGKESKSDVTRRPKRRKLVSNSEDWYSSKEIAATEMNTSSSGNDVVEDTSRGVLTNPIHSTVDLMEVDDEDAICKRTRARYSLANFSLDELETFLQETDDEEDLHNVDDEQEYRKFLTAVLQGGENEDQSIQEDENVYDEDEDSDVDFEIELEEALDSDHDESIRGKKNGGRGVGCRPKTRQNNHNEKKFLVQADRPLRPLVPRVANTQVPPFSSILHFPPSSQAALPVGFTPHQIGQLHCLIHEHTQLLVQVFSLSFLDPSRQQIASETRQLISELVSKREKVLSWRKVPYPDYCFRPPCIHSSVSDGPPQIYPSLLSVDASSSGKKEALGMIPISHSSFPFRTRVNNGGHDDSLQTTKDSLWLPRVSGPILSILDVAPLRIVGSYMDEVSRAMQECKRRHVEGTYDTHIERIPLFPVNISLTPEANGKASKVATSQGPTTVSSPSKVHQSPKKTLAATLVESTKKQSIAFAPKEIVTLAQRFYPLFNAELYPHKPPPVPVANRVLFTDREDEFLRRLRYNQALHEALMRQEDLLAYIDSQEEAKFRKKKKMFCW